MQTTLQELREDILSSVLLSTQTKTIVCAFIDNHLESEKKQIDKAFTEGFCHGLSGKLLTDEDYYNETYLK